MHSAVQTHKAQWHIPENGHKFQQYMFVCNSDHNYYNTHSVLYILQLFNYFNILYFNSIIAHINH